MDVGGIVVLVVFLILATAGVVFAVRAVQQHRTDLARLTPEETLLHRQCVEADRAVKKEGRAHQAAVRKAEKDLKNAQTPPKIAKVGPLHCVSGAEVTLNGNTYPLCPSVQAYLDESGDVTVYTTSRRTMTRMVGGAMLAGPVGLVAGGIAKKSTHHKVDNRELYLMVIGPDWSEVAKINPAEGVEARRLMLAINTAAANCEAFAIQQAENVAALSLALEEARADTARLEGARATRAALGEDPLKRVKAGRKEVSQPDAQPKGGLLPLGEHLSLDTPDGKTPQDRRRR
ncbi:hypothetical protein [Gephyromycinifex aptenodytis]|uniref:hypothetical protein n=1 Tax=Gephyromycinifex aptenodytis TaxID=2716227 RepID=UPI001445A9A2|nr:hypothetical protein [Gephyromycinifex aptenodytis]